MLVVSAFADVAVSHIARSDPQLTTIFRESFFLCFMIPSCCGCTQRLRGAAGRFWSYTAHSLGLPWLIVSPGIPTFHPQMCARGRC